MARKSAKGVRAAKVAAVAQDWVVAFELEEREDGTRESLAEHLHRHGQRYGLSADQVARARHAGRLAAGSALHRPTEQERGEAARIASDIVRELGKGLAEVVAQEKLRGGEAVREDGGRLRMVDRDGLASLYQSGGLTGLTKKERDADMAKAADGWARAAVRFHAGLAYRDGYEGLASGLRSQLQEKIGSGGGDFAPAYALAIRGGAFRKWSRYEITIGAMGRSGRELRALIAVAGLGMPVASLGGEGKSRVANITALLRALDVIAVLERTPGHALLTGGTA